MLDGLTPRLLFAFALCAAVFVVWPGIDMWVAHLFHDGTRFFNIRAMQVLRDLIWTASIVTALGALALWVIWLPLGRQASVPRRLWGWIVLVYVVGPGILVNGILKEHWGRARPAHVFDGKSEFTPPFVISDECARNCSFVSGEAAAGTALAIVLGALVWHRLSGRGRMGAALVLGGMATVAAMMRVITGRHFLSDVIFAAFFTAFIALALWRLMRVAPARDTLSLPAVRADLRSLSGLVSRAWRRLAG